MVQETEEDWVAWTFFEELHEGDRELQHDEQVILENSIGNLIRKIKEGRDDPTSRYNASL
ncbi:hypothetical protein D3C78_1836960 [compost metagenome]